MILLPTVNHLYLGNHRIWGEGGQVQIFCRSSQNFLLFTCPPLNSFWETLSRGSTVMEEAWAPPHWGCSATVSSHQQSENIRLNSLSLNCWAANSHFLIIFSFCIKLFNYSIHAQYIHVYISVIVYIFRKINHCGINFVHWCSVYTSKDPSPILSTMGSKV
jgi:hypothetical protein